MDTPQQLEQVVRGLTEGSNGVSLVGFTNGFASPKMNGVGFLDALLSVTFFGKDGSQKKHISTVKVEIAGLRKVKMCFDSEEEMKLRCLDSTTGFRILTGEESAHIRINLSLTFGVINTVLTPHTHPILIGLGDGPISASIFDSNEEEILKNLDLARGKEMLGEGESVQRSKDEGLCWE